MTHQDISLREKKKKLIIWWVLLIRFLLWVNIFSISVIVWETAPDWVVKLITAFLMYKFLQSKLFWEIAQFIKDLLK